MIFLFSKYRGYTCVSTYTIVIVVFNTAVQVTFHVKIFPFFFFTLSGNHCLPEAKVTDNLRRHSLSQGRREFIYIIGSPI